MLEMSKLNDINRDRRVGPATESTAASADELGSVPSTHMAAHTTCKFRTPWASGLLVVDIQT